MRRLPLASLALIFLHASLAVAQTDRGAITGLVVDEQDRIIPGATVTLTNTDTSVSTAVTTDEAGSFRFPSLTVGSYELSAELSGFKISVQQVSVEVGRTVDLTIVLSPGDIAETVTVEAAPLALDTTTSDTGTTVTRRQILDLPVPLTGAMRNPLNFVVMTPGVSGSVPGAVPDLRLNVSGAPAASTEVFVDGIPVADTNLSGSMSNNHPALESVGEFKISNNSYSAEYGLATGIVSFTLRSGTNDFRGNVFEYLQNDALNAQDFPTKARGEPKAPLKQNEYGFTLGGPIWLPKGLGPLAYDGHNRTFFFTSYSGFKFRPSANNPNLTTIPNRFRQGDFSQLLGQQLFVPNPHNGSELLPLFDPAGRPVFEGAIYDPTNSRTVIGPDGQAHQIRDPFPGNVIPGNHPGLSAASQRIMRDFPQAQTDAVFNNFFRQTREVNDEERFVVKIDHNISALQTLSGSLSLGSSRESNIGTLNELDATENDRPSWQARFAHTKTFSPNLLNNFVFGFLRDRFVEGPVVAGPPLSELGLGGISLPSDAPYPAIGLRNQNGIGGNTFSLVAQNRFVMSNVTTWVRGSHTLKVGGEFRRLQRNERSNNSGRFAFEPTQTALNGVGFVNTAQGPAAVSIPAVATGNSVASFMFGAVDFSRFDIGATTAGYRWLTASGFVQDDWRVGRNLTLNLGFRYDVSVPRTEVFGRVSTVDPELPNPAAGGLPGAYTFYGEGEGRNGRKRIGDIDWKGFQPRLGFAYTPSAERGFLGRLFGDERSVLRGSFAITRPLGNDNLTNGIS
ncbi:MAG: carboxypeptidase regulatory-like domain-containing protein, partial [Vicinamibacteraceae bacterium]